MPLACGLDPYGRHRRTAVFQCCSSRLHETCGLQRRAASSWKWLRMVRLVLYCGHTEGFSCDSYHLQGMPRYRRVALGEVGPYHFKIASKNTTKGKIVCCKTCDNHGIAASSPPNYTATKGIQRKDGGFNASPSFGWSKKAMISWIQASNTEHAQIARVDGR